MVVVFVGMVRAWLASWRSWERRLLACECVACLALRLLLFGLRFKITIGKEKRLSQRVAAR